MVDQSLSALVVHDDLFDDPPCGVLVAVDDEQFQANAVGNVASGCGILRTFECVEPVPLSQQAEMVVTKVQRTRQATDRLHYVPGSAKGARVVGLVIGGGCLLVFDSVGQFRERMSVSYGSSARPRGARMSVSLDSTSYASRG